MLGAPCGHDVVARLVGCVSWTPQGRDVTLIAAGCSGWLPGLVDAARWALRRAGVGSGHTAARGCWPRCRGLPDLPTRAAGWSLSEARGYDVARHRLLLAMSFRPRWSLFVTAVT